MNVDYEVLSNGGGFSEDFLFINTISHVSADYITNSDLMIIFFLHNNLIISRNGII